MVQPKERIRDSEAEREMREIDRWWRQVGRAKHATRVVAARWRAQLPGLPPPRIGPADDVPALPDMTLQEWLATDRAPAVIEYGEYQLGLIASEWEPDPPTGCDGIITAVDVEMLLPLSREDRIACIRVLIELPGARLVGITRAV